jgi:hypothetical protein
LQGTLFFALLCFSLLFFVSFGCKHSNPSGSGSSALQSAHTVQAWGTDALMMQLLMLALAVSQRALP